MRTALGLLVSVCGLLLSGVASAVLPLERSPDPELHAWFESLEQPGTKLPCCSISDCRFTAYDILAGHYQIMIDGWPRVVPDEHVLHGTVNPTGRAVVCYSYVFFGPHAAGDEVRTGPQDVIEILCFLPPQPTS